jgi:tetratricopeptide (TPR) repeat protein
LYAVRGAAYAREGRADEALVDFERAIDLAPQEPAYWAGKGEAHALKAATDSSQRDYLFSLALLDHGKAVALDPEDPRWHWARRRTHERQANYTQAKLDHQDASRLALRFTPPAIPMPDPAVRTQAQVRFNQAALLSRTNPQAAVKLLSEALRMVPYERSFYAVRAEALVNVGDLTAALADCDRILLLDATNSIRWTRRAEVFRRIAQQTSDRDGRDYLFHLALLDHAVAIDLRANDPAAYESRADTHAASGDTERALEDRETANDLRSEPEE